MSALSQVLRYFFHYALKFSLSENPHLLSLQLQYGLFESYVRLAIMYILDQIDSYETFLLHVHYCYTFHKVLKAKSYFHPFPKFSSYKSSTVWKFEESNCLLLIFLNGRT